MTLNSIINFTYVAPAMNTSIVLALVSIESTIIKMLEPSRVIARRAAIF